MYIIGSVFRGISILVISGLLAVSSALAIANETTEPPSAIETPLDCSVRPKFEPAVKPRPSRNRPFAFNPAMQKISGVFGIDVSRWDHPGDKLLEFPKIFDQGFRFAIVKLSDGKTRKSHVLAGKWWRIDRPEAEKAGFLVGGYHYAWPRGENASERRLDAISQAQKASRAYGKWQPGRLPLVLDLEVIPTGSKWSPRDMTNWALDFLTEAESRTGRPPMIYSYANFFLKHMEPDLRMARYPLWVAHYGAHLREPAPVAPWSLFDSYAIWQFSSSGRTAGTHRSVGDLNQSKDHWLEQLAGRKTNYEWSSPLSDAQIAAFNSIAAGGNGERFHLRTGSTREGLTTWQTWINSPNRCSTRSTLP